MPNFNPTQRAPNQNGGSEHSVSIQCQERTIHALRSGWALRVFNPRPQYTASIQNQDGIL